jgi:HlyD family secretion protein
MKRLLVVVFVMLVVGGGLAAASPEVQSYFRYDPDKRFRFAKVEEGEIVEVVNSSGTVQPVRSVQVGAFVSGPIEQVYVDFNTEVKAGEPLAQIDKRTYVAAVARDQASLANAEATVVKVKALLEIAVKNFERAEALRKQNAISQQELETFAAEKKSQAASIAVAEAAVAQAQATLVQSTTNLEFTTISSPVNGIVIDRKVDPGQTLASQFQTPTMFVVAPDLREKIHVYASVDEADIGLIRGAQEGKKPVSFTVDAYDDLFTGTIYQVRLNPTTTQNVVTYTVVVESSNKELKLLPGMTASLSFEIAKHMSVKKVPNAALRFFPPVELVRTEDKALVEGRDTETSASTSDAKPSAPEKAAAARTRDERHVWILSGKQLRAVPVVTGISDSRFTELIKGDLKPGDRLVTGLKTPTYGR